MRNNIKTCKETGKHCYSSEASATRAMNKYDEIKRVYFCSSCDEFHTTSKTLEETLEFCELSLEEENKLLREKINNIEESKYHRLLKNYAYSFIRHHTRITKEVKEEFIDGWKKIKEDE